jgi:hypothetical protein
MTAPILVAFLSIVVYFAVCAIFWAVVGCTWVLSWPLWILVRLTGFVLFRLGGWSRRFVGLLWASSCIYLLYRRLSLETVLVSLALMTSLWVSMRVSGHVFDDAPYDPFGLFLPLLAQYDLRDVFMRPDDYAERYHDSRAVLLCQLAALLLFAGGTVVAVRRFLLFRP